MDSTHPLSEKAFAEAETRMGRYEWNAAAEVYKQILDSLNSAQDPLRAADIMERTAKCYFKAAFQSESRTEFRQMMKKSQEFLSELGLLHEKVGSQVLARRARSRAMYASFWLSPELDENRVTIQKCLTLAKETVHLFEVQDNKDELAEALLDLLVYQDKAFHLSTERKQLVDLFEAAAETALRIIEELQGVARDETILESINMLVTMYSESENVLEPPSYKALEKKLESIKNLVSQLHEKLDTLTAEALASETSGWLAADLEADSRKAVGLFEKGISSASETRDRYLIGRLKTSASTQIRLLALSEEYVERRREYLEKAIQLAASAIQDLQPSSPPGIWLKDAYGRYVDASTLLALQVETDQAKKKELLRETIEFTRKGMVCEEYSFLPVMKHVLSKAAYFLATMDVSPEEKKKLLLEALPLRQQTVSILEQLCPHSWERGVMLNYSALLKAELSKMENSQARRLSLLEGAAVDMQDCVKLCARITSMSSYPPGMIRVQAQYNESHGDVLRQLYGATLDVARARQAVDAYEETISFLTNSESVGPIPAVRWKIAQTHDSLGEYAEASQRFRDAAVGYRLAGKKLPGLAQTFEEFAKYMEAWALIEDARLKHHQELYASAAEDYAEAANKLKTTKTWGHLSKHYSACSSLEEGEALSSQERRHAAIESFKEAQAFFQGAKNEIESELHALSQPQEKTELSDWLDITQERSRYGLGRTQLEEARVLDARGEEEASSANYRTASETFGSLLSDTRDKRTRGDLEALTLMCEAWAKMKTAELNASPELYAEAAESFTRAERKVSGKRSQLAALANAAMCKALASGSLFRRSRDKKLYVDIKKQLETAADLYHEAGVKRAADWTRATQRFFDALSFLGDAEAQPDPRKKTEFYHLAEKHLSLAAKLYRDAGYFKKEEEALAHLTRARGQMELFITPVEALGESPALTGSTLTPVSFTRERAMAVEQFEAASVVGNATVDQDVLRVGSDLVLELEMANIGKTAATLLKIENVGQEGLEVVKDSVSERIEGSYIDMRGRRLNYLKTHEVKIAIRTKDKGTYELRPRILYVDEKGVYRSFEFEPTRIMVTEVDAREFLQPERRLSAIMFTDIVGYASLTEQNEAHALELLEEHRNLLRQLFPKYDGKEIKTVGDMFLVEFASALEAVRCAARIQQSLSKRNLERSENEKIHIRIGIHVGDVEHSHGDVYGEAVNIASRIEPLAEPGRIVVTRQVYDQIRNRPGIKMESMGSHKLKNVKESLEIFTVSLNP